MTSHIRVCRPVPRLNRLRRIASHRGAFTLIELLIVIAILALLIGILAPALNEARRSGRFAIDLANLRQHSAAAASWAAESKGRMPNLRPSTQAGFNRGGGPRNLPDLGYAWHEIGETAGWGILGGSDHSNMWKWYQPVLGAYMVEGEGVDLLAADIFLSPGDRNRIEAQRDIKRNAMRSPDYLDSRDFRLDKPIRWSGYSEYAHPELGGVRSSDVAWALAGSYRYSPTALYGDFFKGTNWDGPKVGDSFWGPIGPLVARVYGGSVPFLHAPTFAMWRSFVYQRDFVHPSRKVLFWEVFATNSNAEFYNHPGAKVAVTMVDGSARLSTPFSECPSFEEAVDAKRQGDNWGSNTRYDYKWGWEKAKGPKGMVTKNKPAPAWFALAWEGPKGRDF